jgi:hypothetical protein
MPSPAPRWADTNTKLRVAVSNAAATLNSNAARFGAYMSGLNADASGNLCMSDNNNAVSRRISPDGTSS